MFYELLEPLRAWWSGFNVIRYITFRAAMASVTAFALSLWLYPRMIAWLTAIRLGESARGAEIPKLHELHKHKTGTPTMGGLLIVGALVGSTGLWASWHEPLVWAAVAVTVALGVVGGWDDYLKWTRRRAGGLPGRWKFAWQGAIALVFALWCFARPAMGTGLDIPFAKQVVVELGWLIVPFIMLVVVGSSNAVNLADGLDGLAIGCVTMIAIAYAGMSYVSGHHRFAEYLWIPYIPGSGELAVFCAALIGAGMGFLWYNGHPASLFMGDTGSLALGGALGAVAVLIKKELLLAVVGGIFVVEALSVMIQVASYRLTGRRVFLMAPLHHHFQLKGWPENKVTVRFWIVGAVLAMLSISTLKLR
ncbi:MAG: phospho-N-acetylmuramoyl-pentapeptide-transferase [Omnitrophica WOR_2 bacterium RIFCSPHIGHO2_02_FULL_68_15]|nr:MAG: phospho-N-acetylmuramoyl-pentapeptide-transferase [Omnitrophica WOR_2 bacterium RIFCSPHIGHO2_02_FULL_68_15]